MAVKPIPEGYQTVTPYLVVKGVASVIEFVKNVFDGQERMCHKLPDGSIMHAELQIGDSVVMLGEACGEWAPMPGNLNVYVPDVDAAYRRALQAGGTSLREPADQLYGDRSGGVKDTSGNFWWISTHIEDVSPEELKRRMAAQKK